MSLLTLLRSRGPTDFFYRYRMDDAASNYLTGSGTTGGINDSSGNAQLAITPATGAVRPTLMTGGSGGHKYTVWDGVDDRLGFRSAVYNVFSAGRAGITMSAVVRFDPNTDLAFSSRYVVQHCVANSTTSRCAIMINQAGNWCIEGKRLDTETVANRVGPAADGGLHSLIGVWDYTTATQTLYIDGEVAVTGSITTLGSTSAALSLGANVGAYASPSRWWKGENYETAGLVRALSPTEVQDYAADLQSTYPDIGVYVPPVQFGLYITAKGGAAKRITRKGGTKSGIFANT